jgi:beta-lactamase regulating signal transducer with metallopeptidase domain/Skp family chaperone for outer membrane proteins
MTAWLIEALVASSVLMLLVLALRGPVSRRFGAQAAYLLWLLPALRLILPRMPEPVHVPLAAIPVHVDLTALMAAAPVTPDSVPTPVVEAMMAPISWPTTLLLLWLAGALVSIVIQIGQYRRFMALALEFSGVAHHRWGVSIRLSSTVPGPIAAGLFRRTILLPLDFAHRYDRDERRLVLEHEIAHHRRGDLIANAVALIIVSLHWFNPLAYCAYRAFRADQELACDATVLNRAGGSARPSYGSALLKSASSLLDVGRAPAVTCGLGPAAELLKRRMRLIASPCSGTCRVIGSALAAILVLGGLGLTASGSLAAPAKAAEAVRQPLVMLAVAAPAAARAPLLKLARLDAAAGAAMTAPPREPEAPVAAEAPAAPWPPIAPAAAFAPPAPPAPPLSWVDAQASREAKAAAREAANEARAASREAEQAEREVGHEAAMAARDAARDTAQQIREAAREAAQQTREAAREATQAAREAALEAAQQAREAARVSIIAGRANSGTITRATQIKVRQPLIQNCPDTRRAAGRTA